MSRFATVYWYAGLGAGLAFASLRPACKKSICSGYTFYNADFLYRCGLNANSFFVNSIFALLYAFFFTFFAGLCRIREEFLFLNLLK